jgi:phosphate/sulfate permease
MSSFSIIPLILVSATSFVFAANNIGMIKTSFQSVAGRAQWLYLSIAIAGLVLGFVVEGYKLSGLASGDVVSLKPYEAEIAMVTVLAVMSVFTFLRLPASLSNVVLGAILGPAIALGISYDVHKVLYVIAAWLFAPLTSGLLAILLYSAYRKIVSRMALTSVSIFNRISALAITLLSSYTLSANNLGLLLGFPGSGLLTIIVPAVLGVLLLSNAVLSTLGWRMAMLSQTGYLAALVSGSFTLWLYTQFAIPASLTQTVVSGMMALSIYSKPSIVNYRTMFELVGSWPFFLFLSFLVAYSISLM